MLEEMDARWNPDLHLVTQKVASPGYHTHIADGATAHSTREAGDYAIGCLQSGEAWRAQRAGDILRKLASLQVTDPRDQHFGIWGWFAEEPPAKMSPADWNWADFMGVRFAQCLIRHGDQLDAETRFVARDALRRAAWAIFRRNCGPSYTNIAVMGGVACAAAGELLGDPLLLEYGRLRLESVVALVKQSGGFSEYNSPTYTRVVLEECERALHLLKDPTTRDVADALRQLAWHSFAEHFHPGTLQVAGPQSRAYTDWINPGMARYLSVCTGLDIAYRDSSQRGLSLIGESVVPPLPCPDELKRRFAALPKSPMTVTHQFGKAKYGDTTGTTWFSNDACLGSVNRGLGWVQQRAILGYWHTASDPAACLRVRVLKDGRDFASSYLWTSQVDNRLLTAVSLASNSADHHVIFGKPPGGVFQIRDLRVRIQLASPGAAARELGDGRFELIAGSMRAVVHSGNGCVFESTPIQWKHGVEAGTAYVDAVILSGEQPRPLDSNTAGVRLAFALELLAASETPASDRVVGSSRDGLTDWQFGKLTVQGRDGPVRFEW
jgi:hypothetical protein